LDIHYEYICLDIHYEYICLDIHYLDFFNNYFIIRQLFSK